MNAWWIALLAVPVWLTLGLLVALTLGRAVRIRDRRRVARPIPIDEAGSDEWADVLAAIDRED